MVPCFRETFAMMELSLKVDLLGEYEEGEREREMNNGSSVGNICMGYKPQRKKTRVISGMKSTCCSVSKLRRRIHVRPLMTNHLVFTFVRSGKFGLWDLGSVFFFSKVEPTNAGTSCFRCPV